MLKRTQRIQCVGGKSQPQVNSCVLKAHSDLAHITTLVRDGKTSLSHFTIPAESESPEIIPIPEIERVLGVLSAHGQTVNITVDNDALVFKSGSKSTRLTASLNGTAFPHAQETVGEWCEKSEQLYSKFSIGDDGHFEGYIMANDEIRKPFFSWKVNCNELYEALRCDGMNNQKLNRYTFAFKGDKARVGVGEEMRGFTVSEFEIAPLEVEPFEWDFEGGLENIFANIESDAILHFLDFRKENQGIRMFIDLGIFGKVYQAGVL